MPLKWSGKTTKGIDRAFLNKVATAAVAAGATEVNIISGRRTKATNTGVKNSNHLYGHAMDARAFIPGQGWVPLGTLLKDSATGYGLRSGDQAGFYKGKPDPNHVDDGFNVRGGVPLAAQKGYQPTGASTAGAANPTATGAASATDSQFAQQRAMMADAISSIPDPMGPPTVQAPLANAPGQGSVGYLNRRTQAETWKLITSGDDVSDDTRYLSSLAQY